MFDFKFPLLTTMLQDETHSWSPFEQKKSVVEEVMYEIIVRFFYGERKCGMPDAKLANKTLSFPFRSMNVV